MKLILLASAFVTTLPVTAEVTAVAHPDEKFPTGGTVVWSPLFQAAWDRLNEQSGGKPAKYEPPGPLMEKLDRFEWQSSSVMPASGWGIWSGPAIAATLDKANKGAAGIISSKDPVFSLKAPDPAGTAVFGLLEPALEFETALYRSKTRPLAFGEGDAAPKVKFFGVKGAQSQAFTQIKVLAYRPGERCHALEIPCKGGSESVILYRPSAGSAQDFATACQWLKTWRKAWKADPDGSFQYNDPNFHLYDVLKIPYLKLDSTAGFEGRLGSTRIFPGKKPPQTIARAVQKLGFELHERGARVAEIIDLEPGCFSSNPVYPPSFPRLFVYDSPFFVFLWRKDAEWPYFGAWVGDASAMEKWE